MSFCILSYGMKVFYRIINMFQNKLKITPQMDPKTRPKRDPKMHPNPGAKTKVFHWFYNKNGKSGAKGRKA